MQTHSTISMRTVKKVWCNFIHIVSCYVYLKWARYDRHFHLTQSCQPLRIWRISYVFWLFLWQLRLLRILMIFYSFWESFMHVNLSLISRIYYLWKISYNLLFFHYINIIFYAAKFIRLIWYHTCKYHSRTWLLLKILSKT